MSTKVCVLGAGGRMGQSVMRALSERQDTTLVAAVDRPDGPVVGRDCGALIGLEPAGVTVSGSLEDGLVAGATVIDFSTPAALVAALPLLQDAGSPLVTGTTGLTDEQLQTLEQASRTIPVLRADNFSVGVVLMRMLARKAAEVLGQQADVEIIEAHHRRKVDAPSGTALAIGRSVAQGLGVDLQDHADWTRYGQVGPRGEGRIGFSVIRGGDIVGEHTALFAMDGERVELTHRATDRMIFARGAARAAAWLGSQPPGLYELEDLMR
ncbi:4-hydroxy-tetrahydrodipicolinate reductase [uncultured Abyssibacter sp.]|uniref:4-hydroxy-tetrahydrodipicolinate reductase n=1 Tax=uncultured Abyssibacter sp. TaxID=2320202 RepID=UPI0032B185A7